MITAGQRKKMKKVFKKGYSKEVQKLLEEKAIWNKKGFPFSNSYITHVFNGRNTNNDIEEALNCIKKDYMRKQRLHCGEKRFSAKTYSNS